MNRSEVQKEKARRFCPYCDEEVLLDPSPFCQPCQVELRYCLKCNIVVEREATVCPQCGQPVK